MDEFIEAYNKDVDISKVCRTCLTDHGEMISLAVKHGNVHFSAIDVLESFTLLKFEMNSSMPSNICSACYKFIDEVNDFKLRCIRIDSTLRECINLQRNNKEFEVLDINKKQSVKISNNTQKLVSNVEVNDSECNINCLSNSDLGNEEQNCNYNSDDEILSKKKRNLNITDKIVLKHKLELNIESTNKEKTENKVKMYICRRCDFTSHLKWEYTEHRKLTHSKMKRHKSDAAFKCVHCEYITHAKTNLGTHLKSHFGNKPFHCEHCEFKTNFRASLQAHIRIHTGEKPFLCDKCDLRFKQLAHLKQHRLTHSDKRPWPCSKCDYKAKAKRHLDNHIRTHTGEKPYMCDLCSFTCANHVNLLSHKRSHSVEKIFKCNLCTYASNFKKNLSMHAAKHSGVKAFECSSCEYRGTCAQNLRAHMISHSQERPFACVVCAYRTKTNSMLNKHMKTHVR